MRREISISSASLNGAGALRRALSSSSVTSAMLREGRVAVPEKITSSISPPRICLGEVSPIAQRSASTRLDLPQPLGPTMPVVPGSIHNSVGSTKDLKPETRSFLNCTFRAFASGFRQHGLDDLLERLERLRAGNFLAVDEESRRAFDGQGFLGVVPTLDDAFCQRFVGHATAELLLADPAQLGDGGQRGLGVLRVPPIGPGLEPHLQEAEIAFLSGAMRP